MPGTFEYLVFICDHDGVPSDGESRFRNVTLYNVPMALTGEFAWRGKTANTLRHDDLVKSLKRPHSRNAFDYLSSVPVFLEDDQKYHFIPKILPDLALIRDASIARHIEAQTVIRTHTYDQFPQPMAESTMVHFPDEIFAEASPETDSKNVFDCQLLTFVGNRIRLIAHERVRDAKEKEDNPAQTPCCCRK